MRTSGQSRLGPEGRDPEEPLDSERPDEEDGAGRDSIRDMPPVEPWDGAEYPPEGAERPLEGAEYPPEGAEYPLEGGLTERGASGARGA